MSRESREKHEERLAERRSAITGETFEQALCALRNGRRTRVRLRLVTPEAPKSSQSLD